MVRDSVIGHGLSAPSGEVSCFGSMFGLFYLHTVFDGVKLGCGSEPPEARRSQQPRERTSQYSRTYSLVVDQSDEIICS